MLLILFWISFLMFNFSYLFSVLFLGFLVMMMMLVYCSSMIYIKYLVVLIYVSGVVVFIMYISCMCWYVSNKFSKFFLVLSLCMLMMFESGMFVKISDISESLWMFLFFSFLFNSLVSIYSLNLYKMSGSLRF